MSRSLEALISSDELFVELFSFTKYINKLRTSKINKSIDSNNGDSD